MIRRLRAFPLEELLVAQAVPGFLLAVAWTAMYEVYHEEGAYFLPLLQEILQAEHLFPYFLLAAILMAFPLGLIVDSVRQVVGERLLRLPGRFQAAPEGLHGLPSLDAGALTERYLLYRHLRAVLLTPARTAGNLAVVLLVLIAWFVVKIYRMQGWLVFSWTFILGTPLVGAGLVLTLLARYRRDMLAFLDLAHRLSPSAPAVEERNLPPHHPLSDS